MTDLPGAEAARSAPSVLFLALPEGSRMDKTRACCEAAWRAWRAGRRVGLHTASKEQAQKLDTLLWTFSELGFLPHRLAQPDTPAPPQTREAIISWGDQPTPPCEWLFNLAPHLAAAETPCTRVVEIVPGLEPQRSQSRERWKSYKAQGLRLQYRKLQSDGAPA